LAITSRIANAFGVVDGPISASMLLSCTSFLTFCTARVVSPPSSSDTYSTLVPAIVRGRRSAVFFWGMPIADVGPVAETIRPMRICAFAAVIVEPINARAKAMRANTLFAPCRSAARGC